MPKILLEHQLPSNAAPYRRRHSSNTYLGLSPQKRQRVGAAVVATLCLLFFLTVSNRSRTGAVDGLDAQAAGQYGGVRKQPAPVRAQGAVLFGGLKPPSHIVDPARELDSTSGGRAVETVKEKEATPEPKANAIMEEEEELSIAEQEALYFSPPAEEVVVPAHMEPEARKQQLKALVYFLSQGGFLPSARTTIDPDKELTLKYLEAVGSEFDVPKSSVDWAAKVEKAYPLIVFSKSHCPYSKKAKTYLKSVGASQDPYIIEVDLRPDADAIKHVLGRLTNRATFPNVILAFEPLGGGDDIELLHAEGGLARKLREGGVKFGKRPRADVNGQRFAF